MFISEKTRAGLEIVEAALVVGVLGDALWRAEATGINLPKKKL